ncbi:MAG: hypothetical protein V1494_00050 [Candidatus Diapherotrites archaeon]
MATSIFTRIARAFAISVIVVTALAFLYHYDMRITLRFIFSGVGLLIIFILSFIELTFIEL